LCATFDASLCGHCASRTLTIEVLRKCEDERKLGEEEGSREQQAGQGGFGAARAKTGRTENLSENRPIRPLKTRAPSSWLSAARSLNTRQSKPQMR
jgi:hypothetical protein